MKRNARRTSCVKQAQGIGVITNHHGDGVVVKDLVTMVEYDGASITEQKTYSRDILTGELVGGVRDEKTGLERVAAKHITGEISSGTDLAHSTISHNYAFNGLHDVGKGLRVGPARVLQGKMIST